MICSNPWPPPHHYAIENTSPLPTWLNFCVPKATAGQPQVVENHQSFWLLNFLALEILNAENEPNNSISPNSEISPDKASNVDL